MRAATSASPFTRRSQRPSGAWPPLKFKGATFFHKSCRQTKSSPFSPSLIYRGLCHSGLRPNRPPVQPQIKSPLRQRSRTKSMQNPNQLSLLRGEQNCELARPGHQEPCPPPLSARGTLNVNYRQSCSVVLKRAQSWKKNPNFCFLLFAGQTPAPGSRSASVAFGRPAWSLWSTNLVTFRSPSVTSGNLR